MTKIHVTVVLSDDEQNVNVETEECLQHVKTVACWEILTQTSSLQIRYGL